ncbi:MAG: His/Gly/Thr/Pro-type tRNA ligase C-terminal domain-containing protein, partial [Proteobacteria bacterium]|nr:His/Gly/Thr/Pro-type tRNA ligase C-terminal domain-containing protein [Pseudomonadota bacterium]
LDHIDFDDADAVGAAVGKLTSLYARADDIHDQATFEKDVPEARRMVGRGIEVGHIFYFGDKYSKPMGCKVTGPDGQEVTVEMGSYGIGVSRLVGAVIESCHDENGIVWPESVAPFKVGLINLKADDAGCRAACDDIYGKLRNADVEVLYDDRDGRAGVKFADMDLIGLPWQLVLGPRGLKTGVCEVKNRKTGEKQEMSMESALAKLIG